MIEKGYITGNPNPVRKQKRYIILISGFLFFTGVVIILSGLIYMFANLNSSDSFFHLWLPYILTGIAMVSIGVVLNNPVTRWKKHHP